MRIRPLAEADLSLIRAWMRDAPEAPAWSDADLAGIVEGPPADQRRIRRGWIAEKESGSAAGFVVAASLCIPDLPAECELEFVFVSPEARREGIGRERGLFVHQMSRSGPQGHSSHAQRRPPGARSLPVGGIVRPLSDDFHEEGLDCGVVLVHSR